MEAGLASVASQDLLQRRDRLPGELRLEPTARIKSADVSQSVVGQQVRAGAEDGRSVGGPVEGSVVQQYGNAIPSGPNVEFNIGKTQREGAIEGRAGVLRRVAAAAAVRNDGGEARGQASSGSPVT